MISLLAACLVLGSPGPFLEPRVIPQAQQDPAAKAEQQHQEDLQHDRDLGKKFQAEVDKELKPSDDKVQTDRVQRVGKALADIANQIRTIATYGDNRFNTFDYDFHLVKGKDPNAFSLPGGHIYVYEGLLPYIETDDELAGILAHEISHAKFRHVAYLMHQDANLNKITLPLAILGVLAGGVGAIGPAILGNQLVHQAEGAGWSVQAESAADYGGLQLLEKSPWNPTGLLTTMERFAEDERYNPALKELGIFRDHPPSKDRAEALIKNMKEAGVPIQRSKVTTTFRAVAVPQGAGAVDVRFGKTFLFTLSGPDAAARAQTAVDRLNTFFDSTPDLFEVSVSPDGWLNGKGRPLIKLTADDASAAKTTVTSLQALALDNIKKGLFTLGYKTWEEGD